MNPAAQALPTAAPGEEGRLRPHVLLPARRTSHRHRPAPGAASLRIPAAAQWHSKVVPEAGASVAAGLHLVLTPPAPPRFEASR